jgi:C4-dicarboxylate-specific signal transduction histidine kinase
VQRQAELQLQRVHAQRLSTMGAMALELAHELHQPLTAGAAYVNAARLLLQTPEEARSADVDETLGRASSQIVRAGRIIGHLREFVAHGAPDKTFLHMHEIIYETLESLEELLGGSGIRVILDLRADPDLVLADHVQLMQVLINVIRNAVSAMNDRERRVLTIRTELIADDAMITSIADTGPGLSSSVVANLFKPFTTTKPDGMGVGLHISRLMVEEHFGKLWAESRKDEGAIFKIVLPLANGEEAK